MCWNRIKRWGCESKEETQPLKQADENSNQTSVDIKGLERDAEDISSRETEEDARRRGGCAYWRLLLCLLPLAIARITPHIVQQLVFRALALHGHAVHRLAGFGIAYNIVQLFECANSQISTVAQVLIRNLTDRRTVIYTAIVVVTSAVLFCVLISLTPAGEYVFYHLFGIEGRASEIANKSLFLLSWNLLPQIFSDLHTGLLIFNKQSLAVLVSTILNVGVQLIVTVSFNELTVAVRHPLFIPILAVYLGSFARFLTLTIWYYVKVHKEYSKGLPAGTLEEASRKNVGLRTTLAIFGPLWLLSAARAITVPVARLCMAINYDSAVMITEHAILSVVLPVERLFNTWLNRLKEVFLAFSGHKDRKKFTTEHFIIFTLGCVTVAVIAIAVFCLVPDIGENYFRIFFNLPATLAKACIYPVAIFSLFPLIAGIQQNSLYQLLVLDKPKFVYLSVTARLLSLPVSYMALSSLGVSGARLAAAIIIAAHATDAAVTLGAAALARFSLSRAHGVVDQQYKSVTEGRREEIDLSLNNS